MRCKQRWWQQRNALSMGSGAKKKEDAAKDASIFDLMGQTHMRRDKDGVSYEGTYLGQTQTGKGKKWEYNHKESSPYCMAQAHLSPTYGKDYVLMLLGLGPN